MSRPISTFRAFDEFRLDVETKVLWHRGEMVDIPVRAVELLIALSEQPGEVIKRDELLDAVWGEAFVEEVNLSRNVYLLRKTLKGLSGRDFIKTLPRRGYRFEAEVEEFVEQDELTIERSSFSKTVIELQESANSLRPSLLYRRRTGVLVGLGILIFSLSAFSVWRFSGDRGGNRIRTLAVLPPLYDDTSEGGKALAFGLADALVLRLGSSSELVVRPMSSIAVLGETANDSAEAGRRLKVQGVLESTLQETNGRIRLHSRLIRTTDGKQVWAGQFDTPSGNIFRLQDVLAAKVYAALISELAPHEKGALSRSYTASPEAYQAYQRGRLLYFNRRLREENYENAIREFELALSHDPNFVPALAGLADLFSRDANIAKTPEARRAMYERARVYAQRALEIDPAYAEAHSSMAWIKRSLDWDWEASEHHFRTAIALAPNNAEPHRAFSFLLMTLGRIDEAVDHARLACELDPSSHPNLRSYALILAFARRFEESIRQNELAWTIDPDNITDYRYLSMALYNLGRYQEFLDRFEKYPERARASFQTDTYRAMTYFKLGDHDESQRLLADLRRRAKGYESRIRLGIALAVVGETDEALDLLEEGYRSGDDRMLWIKVQPELDVIRHEPRYQSILRKMNLAD